MKNLRYTAIVLVSCMVASTVLAQQKVTIDGQAVIGLPGDGNPMLTLNSERPWVFRQLGVGSGTALELYSTIGLKNFLVTTTGNVGIGVTAPVEKLQVNGNIKAMGTKVAFGSSEYLNDGGSFLVECNGTFQSTLDNADNLGSSSKRWNALWATNGVIQTSDLTMKTNVQAFPYGINAIMKLRPVSFQWAANPALGNKLGLIAQEVQPVISEVVVDYDIERDEQTGLLQKKPVQTLGMYYTDLIPVLIKAMQEQQQLLIEKDSELIALKAQAQNLENRLAKLEQLISAER